MRISDWSSDVCSSDLVVNAINSLLGSYGNTIDLDNPLFSHQGDETAFAELVDRMAGREIGAAFFYGANPAYDYPEAAKFTEALKNVRMKVSFADRVDETAAHCNIQVPDHNSFEIGKECVSPCRSRW